MQQNGDVETDSHLGRIILKNLKKWNDSLNQIEIISGKSETNGSVRIRSIRVAEAMKKRGLEVGDLVVVCGVNHLNVSIPLIASLYIGCSVFPLYISMTPNEVNRLLSLEEPKIVFCDKSIYNVFKKVISDLKYQSEIVLLDELEEHSEYTTFSDMLKPTGTEDKFEATDFDPEKTTAVIICSSGTTGFPKGVCHSHKTMKISVLTSMFITSSKEETDYFMNFSALFWLSGLYSVLLSCLKRYTRVQCAAPFSLQFLEKGFKEYKPSHMFLSPVYVQSFVKSSFFQNEDFSFLKFVILGGSPISPEILKMLKQTLKDTVIIFGYGLSEVGTVTSNDGDRTNTVGKIIPQVKWRVVDPITEKEVLPQEIGELRLKWEALFQRYFKNPSATAEAYDFQGWFKTGDLVTYDEEGYIQVVDRLKECMKCFNFQVTPAELEFEIMKFHDIVQAGVVGHKQPSGDEYPIAFVQKVLGSNITAQQIKDAVKNALSDVKQLRGGVVFMDRIPETPTGKVDKKALKKLALVMKGE